MGSVHKEIAGCRAGPGESVAAFQQRVLEEAAGFRASAAGLVVNLVMPTEAPAPGSFDAIVEIWGTGARSLLPPGQQGRWLVEEIVEKDLLPRQQGRVTPGPRSMPFVAFDPGFDLAGRQARWAKHASLGLRLHTGLARFVRNVVLATLEPVEMRVDGIGGLSFATDDDLRHGLFPTPEARTLFLADVKEFVTSNVSHQAKEHVLLWPSSEESIS